MRLDWVEIDGYKNLKSFRIDFDERCLTTVVIGQNGSGKSNLIEAITKIFQAIDLNKDKPKFLYRLAYRIDSFQIILSNHPEDSPISVNGDRVSRAEFDRRKEEIFPDLIFGYYSGGSRRLESLFDAHQRRYYDAIKTNDNEEECRQALKNRRLFYCRPIHGVLALLAFFAFPEVEVEREIEKTLGITGFHSMMCQFRRPWYARSSGKRSKSSDFWGSGGPAGRTAREIKAEAFHPMALTGNAIDDYRDKSQTEEQYATFLDKLRRLKSFSKPFASDSEMFFALESMDISDLLREVFLWVTRANDTSGDVGFADLSDGERQLLMAMGLIRISRGKRALFLLDEPDTHLNPHWQRNYLNILQQWTGVASDTKNCHFILTSHNPLTISALTRDEVRIMCSSQDGKVTAEAPYADPRGMGFTATLTEIFGLPTTLDPETQRVIDDRNTLAHIAIKTDAQAEQLIEINDRLARLGFLFEDREPLYQDFLRSWHDVRYSDRPPLSPNQIKARHEAMKSLLREMTKQGDKN